MGSKPFQFKFFSVAQDVCAHKVGTDGVLLGAWVKVHHEDKFVLDIGTGSGVIALMLAQRSSGETHIDAVENSTPDLQQALENISRSPWPDKIKVHHNSIQAFSAEKRYDLIVSNPPYFMNSLRPPDPRRRQARHTDSLPFQSLLESTARLLDKKGRLAVILPYTEGLHFIKLAHDFKLFPIRKTNFRTRASNAIERILLELAYQGRSEAANEIILYGNDDAWSSEYRMLTRDFYLEA